MGWILKNSRIVLAGVFACALIAGSYIFATRSVTPNIAEASTETALLKAIATKDSDGDGLPDWEEALYGTNPNLVDSRGLGMPDGEAVQKGLIIPKAVADIPATSAANGGSGTDGLPPPPAEGTLTAAFAQSFFTLYLQAKQAAGGGDLSEEELNGVVNQALQNLAATTKLAPDFKILGDLTLRGTGPDALRVYAADAEKIFLSNTADATTTPLANLKMVVEKDDTTALTRLVSIAKMYRTSAAGLAELAVPTELSSAHLLLVNSLMRMSQLANDFSRYHDDPLASMLALGQYVAVGQNLEKAFVDLAQVYRGAGVKLSPGTPGASFVNVAGVNAGAIQP